MTILLLTLTLALTALAIWTARRIYTARTIARNTRFAQQFRAASILSRAAKYLEQYGTGRDFEYNNARHILLYAHDSIILDIAQRW
jgi:hypothetical protein